MYEYLVTVLLITLSLCVAIAVLYFRNRAEYKRLSKLRNEFMAMMIHELRSPLAVIKGSANMVRSEGDKLSPEQINTMLKQIEESAGDLLEIVNDLLDVSKIEAGKVELFQRQINLVPVLKVEVEKYRALATQKNIGISIKVPSNELMITCDPDKLKHIMNNLLSNAIKFTQKGEITVELRTFHDYVQVSVSDTGIGIPDDLKNKIFEKFVQARAMPVSREKGTGLGLVIVKGIVEAHGGKIWVEDNYPSGAKMIFTLPTVVSAPTFQA